MRPKLEKERIFLTILLALGTGGIYVPFWYLKRKETFNSLSSNKISHELAYFAFAGYFLHLIFVLIENLFQFKSALFFLFGSISGFGMAFAGLCVIILGFEVRTILKNHFKGSKISKLWTFLLSPYYLQYKINKEIE